MCPLSICDRFMNETTSVQPTHTMGRRAWEEEQIGEHGVAPVVAIQIRPIKQLDAINMLVTRASFYCLSRTFVVSTITH